MDDASASKLRWYRFTPDRLVLGLLAVEAFLLLSQWRGWFSFNQHKGWTVLMAVAAVGVALLFLLIWFVVSAIFRWRFQYSLRSLLLLVVVVAVPCSWLATEMQRAKRQRERVADVEAMEGGAGYDTSVWGEQVPEWLVTLFGRDFFGKIVSVTVYANRPLTNVSALSDLESLSFSSVDIVDDRLVNVDITDAALVRLQNVSQLQSLDLSCTEVTGAGLPYLQALGQLHSMSLCSTKITDAGLENVACLQQLRTLDLSQTKVGDSGLSHLRALRQLGDLNLSDTEIGDAGLVKLQNLPKLRHLDVRDTKITNAGIEHITRLSLLTSLNLTGTKVTDAGLVHLRQMGQLRNLCLIDTAITDAGVRHLQGLHNLAELNLRGTKVSDAGLAYLEGLSQLRKLTLNADTITFDGVKKLEKALPKCAVEPYGRLDMRTGEPW